MKIYDCDSMSTPKVFLSHATEDKQRFALPFATALRAGGLDVWVDQWEMLPGDSIVKKIFTEGIEEAAAVVVVISSRSIEKRWVREELDAAVVKRINEESRLIPVVLDNLSAEQVPAAIRHLLWVSVPDPANVSEAARQVIDGVFGVHQRPPLGDPPSYASSPTALVAGLGQVDSIVLKAAGEEAVRDFGEMFDTAAFIGELEQLGIGEDAALEALEVLDHDGFVELHKTLGRGLESMSSFALTHAGLEQCLQSFVNDYDTIVNEICAAVVNSGEQGTDADVAETTKRPRMIVLHVLRLLGNNGLITLSQSMGPTTHFMGVSPKLKRMLAD